MKESTTPSRFPLILEQLINSVDPAVVPSRASVGNDEPREVQAVGEQKAALAVPGTAGHHVILLDHP